MNASPKIDLSAIMKKSNNVETGKEELSIPEEKIESKSPHISIGSIRTSKSNDEKEEIKEDKKEEDHEDKEEELIEVLNGYENGTTDNTIKDKETKQVEVFEKIEDEKIEEGTKTDIPEEKNLDESIKKIEEEINEAVEEETKEKFKLKEKKIKEEEKKELFGNYKSDYEEKTIIENIKEKNKNFKEKLKEPRTRITLVISLLVITASIISGLFIYDPDNYSVDKYKTRIISNVNKVKAIINKPWIPQNMSIQGVSFDILVQEKLFSDQNYKYQYKNIVYESKTELENILKSEAKLINEEIARKKIETERLEAAKLEAEKIAAEASILAIENKKREVKIIKDILIDKFKYK